MSTRARKGSWLGDLVGQFGAVAAVPVAIALALALKPQPSIEKRTEPLWHDAAHTNHCPACRLLTHQAAGHRLEATDDAAPPEPAPSISVSVGSRPIRARDRRAPEPEPAELESAASVTPSADASATPIL